MDWNRCGYSYGLGCRVLIDKTLTEAKSPLGEFGWDGAAGASAIIDADNHVAVFMYSMFWHVILLIKPYIEE